LAGCGAVLPEDATDSQSGEGDDTASALPRFCDIQALAPADANPYRFDVMGTVRWDRETVYDNPREIGDGFPLVDDEGVDWLGDRAPYRITIPSVVASEPATYNTADASGEPGFGGCTAYTRVRRRGRDYRRVVERFLRCRPERVR
jgi:hypothetical protein